MIRLASLLLLVLALGCQRDDALQVPEARADAGWSPTELALLTSLSIARPPEPPPQPSNRFADDPRAAELGHRLFFSPALSRNGAIACVSCHEPQRLFTDGRVTSIGLAKTDRNAPTLVGAAHSRWMFWDGRRDSLWAQALAPFEAPAEMGNDRVAVVRTVLNDPLLGTRYRELFRNAPASDEIANWPPHASPVGTKEEQADWNRMKKRDREAIDRAFSQIGKAIAAYERLLQPGPSRFDRYAARVAATSGAVDEEILSKEEVEGLRLFLDGERTLCLRCHNGPLLTNQSFHHVATAIGPSGLPELGRFLGIQAVLIEPFNCLGRYSDARPEECLELRFLDKAHVGAEMGKFKTPTLRGLSRTAPYFHDGRAATLAEVIDHYARSDLSRFTNEITPLDLDERESRALIAFLESLDGGIAAEAKWLAVPPREIP